MLNIAVFMPYRGLYSNTKILCLTHDLARKGANVDLYVLNRLRYETAPAAKLHPNINVIDLGRGKMFPVGNCKTREDFVPPITVQTIRDRADNVFYDYAIGIDGEGMLYAHTLHKETGCPFAYLSQKLYRVGYAGVWTDAEMAKLKDFERELIFDADLFMIQDFQREDSFFENIGLQQKHPNIMHVPASVLDFRLPVETNYWHEKFQLPPEKRIILSVGHFNRYSVKDELIESCLELPDDRVIVFHGRFDAMFEEELAPLSTTGKVFLSSDVVSWRQVPIMVASADIGLACFYEFNINQYLAARASTTLAYFAMCGIPVICPNYSTFREVTDQYHNGVCIEYPHEFPRAIDSVLGSYLYYSSGARDAFDELYHIDLYSEQLWEYIRDLKNTRLTRNGGPAAIKSLRNEPNNQYSVATLLEGIPNLSS